MKVENDVLVLEENDVFWVDSPDGGFIHLDRREDGDYCFTVGDNTGCPASGTFLTIAELKTISEALISEINKKTLCRCCYRVANFGCRFCHEPCCEQCFYGKGIGNGCGHKWRCSYDECKADDKCSPRCPDPVECDHFKVPHE